MTADAATEEAPSPGDTGTVERLAEMHRAHRRDATPVQRLLNGITGVLSRPTTPAVILLLIALWVVGNLVGGEAAPDPFPFAGLELVSTVAALLVALVILTTQRHGDELADRRAQMTLQVSALSEQKIAKVIELLEEQRRENPMLASRDDAEATALAHPCDPLEAMGQFDEAVERD